MNTRTLATPTATTICRGSSNAILARPGTQGELGADRLNLGFGINGNNGPAVGFGSTITSFTPLRSGAQGRVAWNTLASSLGTLAIRRFTVGHSIGLNAFVESGDTAAGNAVALTNANAQGATLNFRGSFGGANPRFADVARDANGLIAVPRVPLRGKTRLYRRLAAGEWNPPMQATDGASIPRQASFEPERDRTSHQRARDRTNNQPGSKRQ